MFLPEIPPPGFRPAGSSSSWALLWLAGVAMRMTILAVPPVIPLVHDDLHMSETQVGLLIGLPLSIFALAAIPGSLLIARIGPRLAVIAGMVIAALAGAARAAAIDVCNALRRGDRDRIRRRHHAAGDADLGTGMAAEPDRDRHARLYQRHADGRDLSAGFHAALCAAAGRRFVAAQSRCYGPFLRC